MNNLGVSRASEIRDYIKSYKPMIADLVRKELSNFGLKFTNDDVNEILQESLLVLMTKLRDPIFELRVKESTFIYSVASNKIKELIRARNKTLPLDSDYDIVDEAEEESDLANKRKAFLKECLNLLDGVKKKVCLLFFFENLPHKTIAGQLGLASDRVSITYLDRAKKSLTGCIKNKR